MVVIKRLAVSWEDALFAVVAALAWLSAWIVSCPQVCIKSVAKAGVAIKATIPSPEPIVVSIEDDDPESEEDDLELCWFPGVRLTSAPSLTLSHIIPPQSISLSPLAPEQRPLRC
jgi:hypothetical protein